MNSRPIAAAAIFVLCAAGAASAETPISSADMIPDTAIDQLRKDARAEKRDVINGTMSFTSDEAAKFWPLYKDFEVKRRAIGDEQLALVKDYADHYSAMTDAKAAETLAKLMSIEDKSMAAKRAFVRDLQKVLPAKTVARYYQVENRLDLLVGLELASQLPVIKQ
jgi:hypothetical protein